LDGGPLCSDALRAFPTEIIENALCGAFAKGVRPQ
jgi:hypothetical protein